MKTTILTSLIFGGLCLGSCQNADEPMPDKGPVAAKLSSKQIELAGISIADWGGFVTVDGGAIQ